MRFQAKAAEEEEGGLIIFIFVKCSMKLYPVNKNIGIFNFIESLQMYDCSLLQRMYNVYMSTCIPPTDPIVT